MDPLLMLLLQDTHTTQVVFFLNLSSYNQADSDHTLG